MYQKIANEKFINLKNKKSVLVLGIETSCDETAASVVKNGNKVLSTVIYSQISIHREFGGVVPEVASRNHLEKITQCIDEALKKANILLDDIDAIAVTYGAGLLGALLVGVSAAKALAYYKELPLIKVNHIEAHIFANYICHKTLKPPFLALVASGGHTGLFRVEDYNAIVSLGGTVDDAIGEAFDKVARVLGLPYPGGPEIDRLSKEGKPNISFFKNPKPSVVKDLRLSYSGLKTATINYINNETKKGHILNIPDICASFTVNAVVVLVNTAIFIAKKEGLNTIAVAGGVACNSYLKEALKSKAKKEGIEVFFPSPDLCTDNAAMVASRAYYSIINGTGLADLSLNASSSLEVEAGQN